MMEDKDKIVTSCNIRLPPIAAKVVPKNVLLRYKVIILFIL